MNAFTKVLIVFMLILSIAFAAVQMVLFDLRVDYADKYTKEHDRAEILDKDIINTKALLADAQRDLVNAQTEGKRNKELLEQKVDTLTTSVTSLETERDGLKIINGELVANVGAQVGLIDTVRKENDGLKAANAEHVKRVDGLQGDITNLGKTIDGLSGVVRTRDNSILEIKAERLALTNKVSDLTDLVEVAQNMLGVTLPPELQKQVIGHIAAVGTASPLGTDIVMDRGKRDGVKLGYVFAICDGTTVKGWVKVTEVDDRFCGGRAVMSDDFKAAIGYKIRNDLTL